MASQLQAALAMIKPGMAISLGGGNHMQQLAQALQKQPVPDIQLASPSALTRQFGGNYGLTILPALPHYDVAFDGCDSVDAQFDLLKSNGGLFLLEQLAAARADQYVILVPEKKVTTRLNLAVPLTVEVVPEAADLVMARFGGTMRQASNYMGATFTQHGHVLLDIPVADGEFASAASALMAMPGVVATSFCLQAADVLLIEAADGRVLTRRRQ